MHQGRGFRFYKAMLDRIISQFRGLIQFELFHGVGAMLFNGSHADIDHLPNLLAVVPFSDEFEDFTFPPRNILPLTLLLTFLAKFQKTFDNVPAHSWADEDPTIHHAVYGKQELLASRVLQAISMHSG